jgi:hypothetical protein
MRIIVVIIISLVTAAVGCSLYVSTEEQASHGRHRPDAGTCCQSDASVGFPDGGSDGCLHPDGGSCLDPDGGVTPSDAGTIGLDGAMGYPDAAHH